MFCPDCGSEYVDGLERCPVCDVPLVMEPDRPPIVEPVPSPDLQVVLSGVSAEAIAVAKSILIDAQIPFSVRGEEVQDLFGYGRFPAGSSVLMGPVQIVVAPEHGEAAGELLALLRDDSATVESDEDAVEEPYRSVWALAKPVSKVAVWIMLGFAVVELIFVVVANLMNSDWAPPF